MSVPDLRDRLQELAEAVPAGRDDPSAAVARRVQRQRRRVWGGTAAALVVLLLAATTAVLTRDSGTRSRHVTAGPAPEAGSATARQLAQFHWSSLPPAPIQPRSDASVVWTGRELVVWGGMAATSDGAALDPATNRWRLLSPSPLALRWQALTLWTGQEMLVIGGTAPAALTAEPPLNDGAYEPASDRWRVLPPRPPKMTGTLSGAWDGHEAVVLSSSRRAAAYDPAVNQWRSLPSVPETPDQQILSLVSAWAGDRLLVWAGWMRDPTAANSTLGRFGNDLWSIDPSAGSPSWTKLASPPAGTPISQDASTAIWTGTEVLFPAIPAEPPPGRNYNGSRYDPARNAYRSMAHGPVDDGSRDGVWTNGALVRTAQGSVQSPEMSQPPYTAPAGFVQPGDAAAWDPAANRWTVLPRAPVPDFDRQLVWTGREILSIGQDIGYRFGP